MTAVLPTLYPTNSTVRAVDLGPAVALSCRECGHRIDLGPFYACTECFGPLEVAYEFALTGAALRERIEAGPNNIWRYAPLLPVPTDVALEAVWGSSPDDVYLGGSRTSRSGVPAGGS